MKAEAIVKNLTGPARKALLAALDEGDKWGYRCFSSLEPKDVVSSVGDKYVRWGDLSQCGLLTALGGEVAKLAKGGKRKAPEL
jgi:hypothetical protein